VSEELLPPQDLQMEQCTLGAMMVEPGVVERVLALSLAPLILSPRRHARPRRPTGAGHLR